MSTLGTLAVIAASLGGMFVLDQVFALAIRHVRPAVSADPDGETS